MTTEMAHDDWHVFHYVNTTTFDEHFRLYDDMVVWIKENVENYHHYAMWTKISDCIYVKLQRDKDAVIFLLRWPQ